MQTEAVKLHTLQCYQDTNFTAGSNVITKKTGRHHRNTVYEYYANQNLLERYSFSLFSVLLFLSYTDAILDWPA